MSLFKRKKTIPEDAVKEALNNPNGWVYAIDEAFKNEENVPPQAIQGAWKVNSEGIITDSFIPNPNYHPPKKA
ncbi:hypothetical protein G7092_17930 [Mucilaginibacter sp. HC2]|uniref:hypothetical protein n=1 Tax=Mucilaginibacter inviolabilis TaxID=2714892 RepID=UPI001408AF75|nr:hypothetical protein [Mucilaginibacter inviolabilis]NHA05696.1 hypothetical protein [Mucilaginibacter inviolabilis]